MNTRLLVCSFLLLFAVAALASGKSPLKESPIAQVVEVLPPIPKVIPETIVFTPLTNHTNDEVKMVAIAQTLANQLVRSQCFLDFMKGRKLIQTNGLSPENVVHMLKTSYLTTPVDMYFSRKRVVGYRQPPSSTIHTNRKYHAGATACARASNLTHEWSHVLAFTHDYKATKSRSYSVPYSINAAFQVCCSCQTMKDCTVKP